MPIVMMDSVEFSGIPALRFVVPNAVTADPTGYEAGLIYRTDTKELKYHNGTIWVSLGASGSAGPPTGSAGAGGGDLTGSYPDPIIKALAVTDAKVAAANKDGAVGTPSMRTLGTGAQQAAAGNDARFSDARAPTGTASGDLSGTYPSPQIAAGVIVDADVNASANIAQSKILNLTTDLTARALTTTDHIAGAGLTGGGTLAASRTFAVGAGTGITVNADDVAVNRTTVDAWYLDVGGDTMTGGDLTLFRDPTLDMHAANKRYVDIVSQGFSFKTACRIVSTTNIGLSGLTVIDGITPIANDRVLVAGQSTPSQNGIYLAASGAWSRATDMDASGELKDGTLVPIAEGTANSDSQWMCTAIGASPWLPASSSSTWTKFTTLQDLQAGAGLLKTGNVVDVQSANSDMTVGADNITINSAPKWTTARTVTLTGDVTSTAVSVDGTANWSIPTTIAAGSIVDSDVNASAGILTSKIAGLDTALTGKVPTTRSVIAGNGLTGGGVLSADVTLNVVAGSTLSVTADSVDVVSAPKWTVARTITLTGDVTGTSAGWDGSAPISFATTLVGGAAFPKKYAIDVPAGTTGIVITHNLNTLDVQVEVYRKSDGHTIYCDVMRPSVNTVTLGFAAAISPATYRVVVTG